MWIVRVVVFDAQSLNCAIWKDVFEPSWKCNKMTPHKTRKGKRIMLTITVGQPNLAASCACVNVPPQGNAILYRMECKNYRTDNKLS